MCVCVRVCVCMHVCDSYMYTGQTHVARDMDIVCRFLKILTQQQELEQLWQGLWRGLAQDKTEERASSRQDRGEG